MQVKYDESAEQLRKEQNGFVFQNSNKFNIATVAKRGERARYVHQKQRMIPLMSGVQHWRNLSAAEKLNWKNFAAANPQPTKADPTKFLSGYQCFTKRQAYLFLNYGQSAPYMVAPALGSIIENPVTIGVTRNAAKLLLHPTFSTTGNDTEVQVFMSFPCSPGMLFPVNFTRYAGHFSNAQQITPNYSPLYNRYCVTDPRGICREGWRVSSISDWESMRDYLGGALAAGNHLKETGDTHWLSQSFGTDNSSGFTGRGSGYRNAYDGNFYSLKTIADFWTTGKQFSVYYVFRIRYSVGIVSYYNFPDVDQQWKQGISIRLVKPAAGVPDGTVGSYTSFGGIVHSTVVINGLEWLQQSLYETKFANGEYIHGFDGGTYNPISNEEWVTLSSAAMCFYENNPSIAGTGGSSEVDITELYKLNFGVLPESGQNVLLTHFQIAKNNGQFFPRRTQNITVL